MGSRISWETTMAWEKAIPLDRLERDGRAVAKVGTRQIAFFRSGEDILACNNRCPHEGYLYCGPVMRHPAAPLQAANFSSAI